MDNNQVPVSSLEERLRHANRMVESANTKANIAIGVGTLALAVGAYAVVDSRRRYNMLANDHDLDLGMVLDDIDRLSGRTS